MKIERHAKIIDLINRYDIETQEELAERLNREGFAVTQATVSRDIRELKLTKISQNGEKQKYAVMAAHSSGMDEKYLRVLKDGFVSMDMAQNILVVKTVAGMAMAVAAALAGGRGKHRGGRYGDVRYPQRGRYAAGDG